MPLLVVEAREAVRAGINRLAEQTGRTKSPRRLSLVATSRRRACCPRFGWHNGFRGLSPRSSPGYL